MAACIRYEPMTTIANPLADADDASDRALVERAVEGDRAALHALVTRHQPFVFNLALKMFGRREDAEDLTQEVLVKVITSLRSFRHDSALRTWLYRITVNHFLKTRRRAMELLVDDFATYFDAIASTADSDEPDRYGPGSPVVEELRIRCTTGMLVCLDREQRLVYLLGAMFGASHTIAADILEITPGNFRVRLHRARRDLSSWMSARCGLVNTTNPCRCHRKTAAYVREGLVDPARLVFNADYLVRVDELVRARADGAIEAIDDLHDRVFASHPFAVSKAAIVEEILGNEQVRSFFALSERSTLA